MVENQIRRITVKNLWKFVKTSGIYFIGTVLHKLITFFLLPIYTKYIDKADLGTYDLATAYINFLCSILFLDIWSGIMRFAFEYEGEERKFSPVLRYFIPSCYLEQDVSLISSIFHLSICMVL